ncbi:MAG TPA: SDR family oxidoreductase, partial [Ktedonobacteraceae bacterium]|nr:SDR family oxidoreductase [Ktedonobacteraceae bacterium]
ITPGVAPDSVSNGQADASSARLHPLVHQNTSRLGQQNFTSYFTGREKVLADHVVKGVAMLSGAAHLEMARAAIMLATAGDAHAWRPLRLKDIAWRSPIIGERPLQVDIRLYEAEQGAMRYQIWSSVEQAAEAEIIYSQGSASFALEEQNAYLDLSALRRECSQDAFSASQCYQIFRSLGIVYGESHQCIGSIYRGNGQVLAHLRLSQDTDETREAYLLPPGIIDASWQAALGLVLNEGELKLSLPYLLQEVDILGACTGSMWAWVRPAQAGVFSGQGQMILDIDLCDEQGAICVRVKGLVIAAPPDPERSAASPASLSDTVMLVPVWESVVVTQEQVPGAQILLVGGTPEYRAVIQQQHPEAQILLLAEGDDIERIVDKLQGLSSIEHIVWMPSPSEMPGLDEADALITGQTRGVIQLFQLIKALLRQGYGDKKLQWSVCTIQAQTVHWRESGDPVHSSVHGLVGSMAREYPLWSVCLVDLPAYEAWPATDLLTLSPDSQGSLLAYREQTWHRRRLLPLMPAAWQQTTTLYRRGGVYVVIGGAGGIGEAWSEYMIQTYQAQIIWLGRRAPNEAIQAKIARLARSGSSPYYIMADATEHQALERAYKEIKQRYGQIHGVVHSALVLQDQSLARMDLTRFKAGLAAKVDVSVQLARVFGQEPLDFALFFSSLNSFFTLPGQSNYAAGCSFEDEFVHQLARQWSCAVKVMNWGYWGSVGIVASRTYQESMARMGIGSIEAPEAMQALETLLVEPIEQMGFIKLTGSVALPELHATEVFACSPTRGDLL